MAEVSKYVHGWLAQSVIIVPLRGSILQAETCQILSLAENPRWSRVWQNSEDLKEHLSKCEIYVCDNSGCKKVFDNSTTVKEHIKEMHKKGSPEHYSFSYYICHSKDPSEKEVNKNYIRILPSDW